MKQLLYTTEQIKNKLKNLFCVAYLLQIVFYVNVHMIQYHRNKIRRLLSVIQRLVRPNYDE